MALSEEAKQKRREFSTLSQENDFTFGDVLVRTADELNDSDSDGSTVDSEVEDAIMAELYFRDVKSKSSGKRVSIAKQLGSRKVRLDHSADGSRTSISFIMDTHRVQEKKGVASPALDPTRDDDHPNSLDSVPPFGEKGSHVGGGEQGGGVGESRSNGKKYHIIRKKASDAEGEKKVKHRWGRKSPKETGTSDKESTSMSRLPEGEGEEGGREEYVGVRQMEEWDEDSSDCSNSPRRSSDMDLSDNDSVGQLFLEVDEKDKWHIILKDVMGGDRYEQQYGSRSLGGKSGRCYNCKQKCQHKSNNCPFPVRHQVCYICAGYDHISSKCTSDFCTHCFQKQHRGKPCSTSWGKYTTCQRCYCTGHNASMCHEWWRQYHNTTGPNLETFGLYRIEPSLQRQSKRVFCFNCARRGHFGHECPRRRPQRMSTPLSPHIAAYDAPSTPLPGLHKSSSTGKRKRCSRFDTHTNTMSPGREDRLTPPRMNPRKGDGLLEMPPRELSRNGHLRSEEDYRSHEYAHQMDQSRRQSFGESPQSGYGRDKGHMHPLSLSRSPAAVIHQARPSLIHTPPQSSGYHFSDSDSHIAAVEPLPLRTTSDPQYRHFPPTNWNSPRDPHAHRRHRSLQHEEQDFPRTPLPGNFPRVPRHSVDFGDLHPPVPPPAKRRRSEPIDRRLSNNHSSHERPYKQHRYSLDAVDNTESRYATGSHRSSGYEQGFRGSERAVSLIQTHHNNSRTPHYGNH